MDKVNVSKNGNSVLLEYEIFPSNKNTSKCHVTLGVTVNDERVRLKEGDVLNPETGEIDQAEDREKG